MRCINADVMIKTSLKVATVDVAKGTEFHYFDVYRNTLWQCKWLSELVITRIFIKDLLPYEQYHQHNGRCKGSALNTAELPGNQAKNYCQKRI